MKDKKKELLKILQSSNKPITGKELADKLSCSPRTIINYVNYINSDSVIIGSNQEGYFLKNIVDITEKEEIETPQDKSQRMYYILKLILLSGEKGIDSFDLADELAISYSSLKKEIIYFNSILKSFNISIISRNNNIYILGEEKNKRKAMTYFIHKMQGDCLLDKDKLRKVFSSELIDTIEDIIDKNLKRFNYTINDFSLLNLLLHLAIITQRLLYGESISEYENSSEIKNNISSHIIREVEYKFKIKLNECEYAQMESLIMAHIHSDNNETSNVVDKNLYSFMNSLCKEVKDIYYLDFTDEKFLVPFCLHIQSLLLRLQGNIQIDNPVKETFRNNAPFLYDVAVYMLKAICKKYNIKAEISDNEFTFVVMHLSLEVERQKQNDNLVNVLIYVPKYLGIEKVVESKLLTRFEDTIKIIGICNFENEINNYDFDVLVSVLNISSTINKRFVKIGPTLKQTDYNALCDVFTLVSQDKIINNFKNVFPFFFDKKNFIYLNKEIDKKKAINIICNKLKENNYVSEEFEEKVIDREKAISTAYYTFAVPHAVSNSVYTQTVGVLIDPKGIKWDDKTIYAVMLMAVNPEYLNEFEEMYNALLLILLESDCIKLIKDINDFEDFKKIMTNINLA